MNAWAQLERWKWTNDTMLKDRCLKALTIVAQGGWLRSKQVGHLQLASLEVCKGCRDTLVFHVRILSNTRAQLLEQVCPLARKQSSCASRVPSLRVHGITWGLEQLPQKKREGQACHITTWPRDLRFLTFEYNFDGDLQGVEWSARIERITLGYRFNQSIEGVVWPKGLRQLTFGDEFDKQIDRVIWPAGLKHLTFGYRFNQTVHSVLWPKGLKQLTFGHSFNQAINLVQWPCGMRQLEFGHMFDQSISGVQWPAGLEQLTFGHRFNHSLDETLWPPSLHHLTFGFYFNQPVDRGTWPSELKQLRFYRGLNHMVEPVMSLARGSPLLVFQDGIKRTVKQVEFPLGFMLSVFKSELG
ncbi:unnamed protein product [Choristocarpus tenellus]